MASLMPGRRAVAHSSFPVHPICAIKSRSTCNGQFTAGFRKLHRLSFRKPTKQAGVTAVNNIMGTWIARNPEHVNFKDIVAQLPSIVETPQSYSRLTAVTFLATPSFASWFEDSHPFLPNAVRRINQQLTKTADGSSDLKPFRTTSAIVDLLPIPSRPFDGVSRPADKEELNHGSEGIAFYLYSQGRERRDKIDDGQEAEDDATLGFIATPFGLTNRTHKFQLAKAMRLPTANTLFVNGSRSTMFTDLWRLQLGEDSQKEPEHLVRQRLKSVNILFPSQHATFTTDFDLPLKKLTDSRIIVSSMGNIIRELEGPVNTRKPLPASTELEAAVPRFLDEINKSVPGGTLQIFALIVPKTLLTDPSNSSTFGNAEARFPTISVSETGRAIEIGARLHRVTSGGGGWGKKQGLLSIEPAVSFESNVEVRKAPFEMLGEEVDIPKEIFAPGDAIQFFASYHLPTEGKAETSELPASKGMENWGFEKWSDPRKQFIELGVVPSSERVVRPTSTANEATGQLIFYQGSFGMLAESGACFETLEYATKTRDDKTGEITPKFQSRIDVPHTRLRFMIAEQEPTPRKLRVPKPDGERSVRHSAAEARVRAMNYHAMSKDRLSWSK